MMMNLNPATIVKRAGTALALVGHLAQGGMAAELKTADAALLHAGGELTSHMAPLKKDTLQLAQVPSINPNAVPFNQQGTGTTGQGGATVTNACAIATQRYEYVNGIFTANRNNYQRLRAEYLQAYGQQFQGVATSEYLSTDAGTLARDRQAIAIDELARFREQIELLRTSNDERLTQVLALYQQHGEQCNTPLPELPEIPELPPLPEIPELPGTGATGQ